MTTTCPDSALPSFARTNRCWLQPKILRVPTSCCIQMLGTMLV